MPFWLLSNCLKMPMSEKAKGYFQNIDAVKMDISTTYS